jgi:hypothetical protein
VPGVAPASGGSSSRRRSSAGAALRAMAPSSCWETSLPNRQRPLS